MIPRPRGRRNAVSSVFLTVPRRVTISRHSSSRNSRTGIRPVIFSPSPSCSRLTIARPPEVRVGHRQVVDLQPVDLAVVGEEEDVVVRQGDEHVLEEVAFLGVRRGDAPAAAVLGAVGAGGEPLDVAVVGDGHHHVLLADQGFLVVVAQLLVGDHAAARVGVLGLQLAHVGADQVEDQPLVGEDGARSRRCRPSRPVYSAIELVGLQAGQLLEPHRQDRVGLHPGQAGGGLGLGVVQGPAEDLGRDLQAHQPGAGLGGVGRRADHPDDLVDVGQGDQQAFDDVGPRPRLAELVLGPAADDVDPVLDEEPEELLQRQGPGPAVDQGQHDHAEGVLQRRELEELVEDDVGVLPLLDLHDDPDRLLAVALVLRCRSRR